MSRYDSYYPPFSIVHVFTEDCPHVFIIADVLPLKVISMVSYKEKSTGKKTPMRMKYRIEHFK